MDHNILDAITEKLAQYPAVNFTRKSDAELEIYPRDERGFPIYIQLDERENTLHFGSFHWHYDNTEEETNDLLDHLMLGLTGLARVKEFARHGKAYKWVLEVQDQIGTWHPDGMMGTFSFQILGKAPGALLAQRLITSEPGVQLGSIA